MCRWRGSIGHGVSRVGSAYTPGPEVWVRAVRRLLGRCATADAGKILLVLAVAVVCVGCSPSARPGSKVSVHRQIGLVFVDNPGAPGLYHEVSWHEIQALYSDAGVAVRSSHVEVEEPWIEIQPATFRLRGRAGMGSMEVKGVQVAVDVRLCIEQECRNVEVPVFLDLPAAQELASRNRMVASRVIGDRLGRAGPRMMLCELQVRS